MATQQPIIAATFQCGWVPEQHDYSLVVLPGAVNFDSEGNPSAATVSVNVYHTVDGERLPLAVNTSAASHYLLAITTLANGKLRLRAATSLDAASLSTAVALRFDLVAKADVTVPSSSNYIYDEGAILRSESVSLTHDGTQGGFTSIAFTRAKTQPGTPSGGTYDDPVPTTAGWSDAPPADDPNDPKPLWMSRARFEPSTTDQQGWSEPVPVADDVDIEFIFTPNEEYDTPEKTHPHPKYTNGEGDGWGKDATDAVWMAIAKKSGGAWGDWNVMRVKGESAYTLDLDNEMEGIPCDHLGNPTQTGTLATSNAKVYKGGKPDTEGWSFYHVDTGCKASMIAGKVTVTEISADKASVKVMATKGSVSLSAVMSLYKAKAGGPGEDAVAYSIDVSASSISRDKAGNLNPATITATKTKTTGAAYADTKEKVLTCRLEGTAYASDNVLADTSKESGTVSNIPDSCTAVIFKLYENYGSSSAKVLDRERVPIVSDGRDGKGLAGVTDYYAVSASKTTAPTEWTTAIPTMTPVNRYLWNYEEVTYSDGSVEETAKRVIGVYGDKGVGISDVEEYFLATSLGSGVTADHDTYAWTTEVQSVSAEKKYLWNYEKTIYTDGSARATEPHIIGTYGRDGKDGDDGKPGKDVWTPPPMQWSDYPDGYAFQTAEGTSTRMDCVIHGTAANGLMMVYRCIRSHSKGCGNDEPGIENSKYWAALDGGPFHIIATNLLLAANAVIDLLTSNGIRVMKSGSTDKVSVLISGGEYPIICGSTDPATAPTKIHEDGTFYTTKAVIEGDVVFGGTVVPRETVITPDNYKQYWISDRDLYGEPDLSTTSGSLDFSKLTGLVIVDASMDNVNSDIWGAGFVIACQYAGGALIGNPEKYIGSHLRVVNMSSGGVGIIGLCTTSYELSSGISPSIGKDQEIIMECFVRAVNGKRAIGWHIDYQGPTY